MNILVVALTKIPLVFFMIFGFKSGITLISIIVLLLPMIFVQLYSLFSFKFGKYLDKNYCVICIWLVIRYTWNQSCYW